jgi:hypothetical protein
MARYISWDLTSMPRSSAELSALVAVEQHGWGREQPRRRSWFYRFFIAPFVDMDHRAVHKAAQKSAMAAE